MERGQGLTLRVYEVRADGTRRDLEPIVHTFGTRPIPPPAPTERAEPEQAP